MNAAEIYALTSAALEDETRSTSTNVLVGKFEDNEARYEVWFNRDTKNYGLDGFCKDTEELWVERDGLSAESISFLEGALTPE